VSKSANYCWSHASNNEGILLLCEAALGDPNELVHADYNASNLPAGKRSTKGLGRTVPRDSDALYADDAFLQGKVNKKAKKASPSTSLKVPMGVCEDVKRDGLYLQYNEFIVYDIAQVRMRYLIRWRNQ
jgi:poly [ADP-ribose] polymerase